MWIERKSMPLTPSGIASESSAVDAASAGPRSSQPSRTTWSSRAPIASASALAHQRSKPSAPDRRQARPAPSTITRAAGSASAASAESSLRCSARRSMTLPEKPTERLASRSGASKSLNVIAVPDVSVLHRFADAIGEPVAVFRPVGLAQSVAPDRSGPVGVAFVTRDHMNVQLLHHVAERT